MSKSNNTTNTNPRPKPPKENAKTSLCKAFATTGDCKFGDKCTFAHGSAELRRKPRSKIDKPCWWFNRGGCSKSADDCVYQHVILSDIRKPIHLQHPCVWMHVRTPGHCRRGSECGGDHDYELTADEWKHHFPTFAYQGVGYMKDKISNRAIGDRSAQRRARPSVRTPALKQKKPSPPVDNTDEFPTLAAPIKAVKPHPVWSEPLTVIKEAPKEEPKLEPMPRASIIRTNEYYDEPESSDDVPDLVDEVDLIVNGLDGDMIASRAAIRGQLNPNAPIFTPSQVVACHHLHDAVVGTSSLNPDAPIFTPADQRHLKSLVNNALQQLLGGDVIA